MDQLLAYDFDRALAPWRECGSVELRGAYRGDNLAFGMEGDDQNQMEYALAFDMPALAAPGSGGMQHGSGARPGTRDRCSHTRKHRH